MNPEIREMRLRVAQAESLHALFNNGATAANLELARYCLDLAHKRVEHVVTRVNDHYYVCEVCGQAGSERWAILHQYPPLAQENQ